MSIGAISKKCWWAITLVSILHWLHHNHIFFGLNPVLLLQTSNSPIEGVTLKFKSPLIDVFSVINPVKNIMLICSIHHLKVHIHIYTVFSVFRWKTSLHFFESQEMDYFRLPKPPASPPERPVGGTRILCIAVCLPFTKVGPGKTEGIDGKWLGVSMIFRKWWNWCRPWESAILEERSLSNPQLVYVSRGGCWYPRFGAIFLIEMGRITPKCFLFHGIWPFIVSEIGWTYMNLAFFSGQTASCCFF